MTRLTQFNHQRSVGFTVIPIHMEYYHSQAFKDLQGRFQRPDIPLIWIRWRISTRKMSGMSTIWRLHRRTAQWAYVSPIYVKERIKNEYLQNIIKSMVQHLTKTRSTIQRILSLMEGFSVRLVGEFTEGALMPFIHLCIWQMRQAIWSIWKVQKACLSGRRRLYPGRRWLLCQ